jgi:hypothetical protein
MRAAKTIDILGLGAASLLVPFSVAAAVDAKLASFGTGTWNGRGAISGKMVNSGLTAITSGTIVFKLKVPKTGPVSGTGTWTFITNSQGPDLKGSKQAVATLKLSGTRSAVKAAGKVHDRGGTLVTGGVTVNLPQLPDTDYVTKLTIKKAGPCKVSGTAGKGTTWTAVRQGSGCT